MRRCHSRIMLLILIFTWSVPHFQSAYAAPPVAPFNARIAINVGADGRFNFGALPDSQTGGAIVGSSWDLSYRWPTSPWTSFTTFRIDNTDYIYGSNGTQQQAPTAIGNMNLSSWQINDIVITQRLEIVTNPQTGQDDTVKIAYTMRNTGSTNQSVGTRVMIDTELNNNDGAPFRVAGDGIITNEKEYIGSAVPSIFYAFFGLDDSTHVTSSLLQGQDATTPDRLVLASWPLIKDTLYAYTPNPAISFGNTGSDDSAYAVYWNPQPLAPGAIRTYVTYYGLAALNVDLRPPLALGVTAPTMLLVDGIAYTPNPFEITATVFNNGTAPATNVQVTLNLTGTAGLTLEQGTVTQSAGTLNVGGERQLTWLVRAAIQPSQEHPISQKRITYSVVANAANTATKTLTREIVLPPTSTSSYYVESAQDEPNIAWGCAARLRGEQGYVVLIFGSPRVINSTTLGTQLRAGKNELVSIDKIRDLVFAFAQGYMGEGCDLSGKSVRNPDLHIIVTTTNSKLGKADNSALTDEHGIQWAHMIKNINDVLKPKYGFAVAAYGGYDAEPDWSSYPATLDWAEGYNQAAQYAYYNIGSCEGCARHEPRNDWETNYPYKFRTTQRTYHLSWGLRWARAVPQIYHRDYALEWYNVARYASEQGHNMQFPAIMSSCTTTSCTIDNTSPWQNTGQDDWLSPLQAWQAMYDTFNASTTPESINGQSLNLPNPIRHQIQSSITDFANGANP